MEYFSHYSYSLIFAKRKGEVVESSCGWGDFFEAKQKPVNNISSSQGHGSEAEYRLGSREGVDEMRENILVESIKYVHLEGQLDLGPV